MPQSPNLRQEQLAVGNLGPRSVASPLNMLTVAGDGRADYIPDNARLLYLGSVCNRGSELAQVGGPSPGAVFAVNEGDGVFTLKG